jgi:hypothetical protein
MLALIIKWFIVLLAAVNAGYMTYDGCRALIAGDYLRPKTGEYAGQLGPWHKVAEKIGIDPMGTFMKSLFVFFGLAGIFVTVAFAMGTAWSWKAMLIFNIAASWNLFFGTASSVLQIILLFILKAL